MDIHDAARIGNFPDLLSLQKEGHSLESQNDDGDTPLMAAIRGGHERIVEYLLTHVSSNSLYLCDGYHRNVLHLMVVYQRRWLVIWSIINKRRPSLTNRTDSYGQSPTDLLDASHGDAEFRRALEEHASVDNAVSKGDLAKLLRLVADGCLIDVINSEEGTPLMSAIVHNQEDVARWLVKASSVMSSSLLNLGSNNALHLLAIHGRAWLEVWDCIAKGLPSVAMHVNAAGNTPEEELELRKDESKDHRALYKFVFEKVYTLSPVCEAARYGHQDAIKRFYQDGYPISIRNELGHTPLMESIIYDQVEAARLLVKLLHGKALQMTNTEGNTALHLMVIHGRPWLDIWENITTKAPSLLLRTNNAGIHPVELARLRRTNTAGNTMLYDCVGKQDAPSGLALDPESMARYTKGLDENAEETTNIKLVFIGHEGVGKSCLTKQLLGEEIDLTKLKSTNAAELFLRRLLLDLLTFKRTTGPTVNDMITARLRILVNRLEGAKDQEEAGRLQEDPTGQTVRQRSQKSETKNAGFLNKCRSVIAKLGRKPTIPSVQEDVPQYPQDIGLSESVYPPTSPDAEPTPDITSSVTDLLSENQRKLIQDMNVSDRKEESTYKSKAFVTMYDFGGEEIFYDSQHSLMTSDSIYMLVFDVSMCLHPEHEKEGLGRIAKWLKAIATYAVDEHESRKGTPPVLMIGSHMDLVSGPDEEKNQYFDVVLEKLKSIPGMKRIWDNHVKGAYFIGHLNDHKRNVFFYPSIWEKIVEIAPLQSQWRKRIPGKWLPLEHELLQHKERGERIMTIEELQNINSSLAVPLDGIGDIKLFLRYLHLTGFMLCFDLHNESPIIVLDPQWVIDAYKCLITARKFVDELDADELQHWEEYESSGKLPLEIMKRLLGRHHGKQFLTHLDILVASMERLGLLVKPVPTERKEKIDYCIVPCMLKKADECKMVEIMESTTTVKTSALCIQFKNSFIPQAVWDKFIAACIHRFQRYHEPGQESFSQLHRDSVILSIDCIWNMMVKCKDNIAKLTLFRLRSDTPSHAGIGNTVRDILENVLQQILTMNHQGHMQFCYYLHSDYRILEDGVAVEAELLLEKSPIDCVVTGTHGRKSVPLHRKDYDTWFRKDFEVPGPYYTEPDLDRQRASRGVDLQRQPSVRELGRAAKLIYAAYHLFFIELGLTDAEICGARQTCSHLSFRTQVTKIFLAWMNPRPDATIEQIIVAMDSRGMDGEGLLSELVHLHEDTVFKGSLLQEEALMTRPRPDDIEVIVTYIDEAYYSLFVELGLRTQVISKAEMTNKGNGIDQVFIDLLHTWITEVGSRATLNVLLLAMRDCCMAAYDLAKELSGRHRE